MAEIDRLDIVIATSVKDAKAQITQLQSELKAMQKTLGNIVNTNAFKNTGKGASQVSNTVRQQSQRMVKEYSKAAKTMDVIRDKMVNKSFSIPDTKIGATKAIEDYKKMYATARDKVLSAQAHGENYGKVYRNNVEQMYKAAEGIKAARKVLNEKAAKDEAYERLVEEERAAREAAQSVEQLAASYDDVAKSSAKIKYVNQSRLDQFRDAYNQGKARIGASPYLKTNQEEETSYRSLRDTIASVADNIRSKAGEMRDSVGIAFENMKAKVDNFKMSMREKAVASGILSYTEDFVTLQKSIEKTRADYARLTQAMQEYKAAGGSENDTTYKRYQARADRMRGEIDTSMNAARQMKMDGSAYEVNTQNAQQNLDRLRAAFQRVTDTAKRAAKAVGSFLLRLTGIRGAANNAKTAVNNVTGVAKKLVKELTRVSKMLKLMVTRMALRKVIENVGDGFKSLAVHSATFNESMSNLINSAKTLGYSIAGMVSPLINALAPALVYIIDLITQAVNAIQQLFAALTGASTWNKAKKFTDSWKDSIKTAGKELKKTVLGFDELNQLQEKTTGSDSGVIKDMFETVQIDPKWKEVAEWLKEMWGKKDFTELGTKLGEDIKKALDSIPWDKIRQTSNDLGTALATLINGLVEVEGLGKSIGKTVAQGVNTVFEFINGFVHNLHWESIGKFIADTFNGFFENIDWHLIEDTVITGMKGLADSINSFVRHFNWDNISNFISKTVNTVASGIYTFVKEVDWKQLGTELGNQLNETIKKIDWREVGRAIGSIIQSAIDFVKSFLKQLKWADIKKAIQDLLGGFFEEVNKEELGKIVAGVLVAVVSIGATKAIAMAGFKALGTSILSALFGSAAVTGATGAATTAGTSVALAYTAAFGSEVNRFIGTSTVLKDILIDVSGAISGNREEAEKLKEAYSGADGTARLLSDGIKIGWYALTGQNDKIKELTKSSKVLTDELGNTIGTVDEFGNSIITLDGNIDDLTKTQGAQINVYDNWRASFADATTAAEIGADRMYDFRIEVDKAGNVTSNVAEHIFPKLGENTYKAASAQESINQAIQDYQQHLEDVKNHQTVYKTTLDVIREAQEKNVRVVETSAKKYEVYKDDIGNVNIVLQDSKPAYEKAGDAAKEANQKVANYVGTTKDEIKIVPISNDQLKESKDAYSKAGESAKDASGKVNGFKDSTKEAARIIPDMTKEVQNTREEISKVSGDVEEATSSVKSSFTKENWTFDGVKEGLEASFKVAFALVKSQFKSFIDDINEKLHIKVGDDNIDIGRVGYATGGFPEDGLFFANHSELVGKFSNGKTAVANNAQIVEGIERGVYSAVSAAMSQQSTSSGYISNEIIVDGEVIARSVSKAQEKRARRYSPQTV